MGCMERNNLIYIPLINFCFLFLFQSSSSLCSPGWPGTQEVAQVALKPSSSLLNCVYAKLQIDPIYLVPFEIR